MITIFNGILVAALVGLVGWIYNQSLKQVKLESKNEENEKRLLELRLEVNNDRIENSTLKTLTYSMDSKIDKKVNEATSGLKDILHELGLTLRELNVTVNYLKESYKDKK